LSAASAVHAQGTATAQVAQLQAANRQQVLTEGAKKEGDLTVYTSNIEDMPLLAEAFTKKTGIKVTIWRAGSEQVTQKVMAEARGRRPQADIVDNNVLGVEALHKEQLLQAAWSPYLADLMPPAAPSHREWAGTTLDMFVAAYNPKLINAAALPKSYQDLLDPRWKGKLSVEAEDYHWFATVMEQLGPENGRKLFRQIVDTNGIEVRKGHSKMANLVVAGELPLALTLYHYKPAQMKAKGETIDWFGLQPVVAHLRGVGVLKTTPRPHAAMLFYDFMLSDAQKILASRFHYPTSTKVDSPLKQLRPIVIDPTRTLELNERWTHEYNDMLKPGGK
jgi:iron(III) transport system substrate-binding protein